MPCLVDTSGAYRNAKGPLGLELSKKQFAALREHFGLERMLWGTDWPCVPFGPSASHEKPIKFLEQVLPDDSERNQILGETPAELFGFGRG